MVVTSIVLGVYSPLRYLQDIKRKKCRPHRVTRFALCVSLLLTFGSTLAVHGNLLAVVITGVYAACGVRAFERSMRKGIGVGGTSATDVICLAVALGGSIRWALSGDPVVGVICSIGADIVAYIPTVRQTWKEPEGEAHWTYTLSALAAGISLVAYPFQTGSWFTAYLVFIGLVMVVCIKRLVIHRRWRQLRKWFQPQQT